MCKPQKCYHTDLHSTESDGPRDDGPIASDGEKELLVPGSNIHMSGKLWDIQNNAKATRTRLVHKMYRYWRGGGGQQLNVNLQRMFSKY